MGDTHMTSTLRGMAGGTVKRKCYRTYGAGGIECSGRPVFIFFIKEKWICAMTRHHAQSNIFLTRIHYCQEIFLLNLASDSKFIL